MSKHIEIRYHYICDMVQRGVVRLHHISINEQIAYNLTKALPKGKVLVFREKLGLMYVTLQGKGLFLSRTLSYALSPYLSSMGRNGVDEILALRDLIDNRIRVILTLMASGILPIVIVGFSHTIAYTSVCILPTSWACWNCHPFGQWVRKVVCVCDPYLW